MYEDSELTEVRDFIRSGDVVSARAYRNGEASKGAIVFPEEGKWSRANTIGCNHNHNHAIKRF